MPRGFSLIELVIGLAIAATLVVLTPPDFATWSAAGQCSARTCSVARFCSKH